MTPMLPTGCVIALVGAESTGKTELARAIAQRLQDRGTPTTLVASTCASGASAKAARRAPTSSKPSPTSRRAASTPRRPMAWWWPTPPRS
jgi:molybdopterin-guanine dinucleotide biosynthesis protein